MVLKRLKLWGILLAFGMLSGAQQTSTEASPRTDSSPEVTLHYGIEWRLIRAGNARLTWNPRPAPLERAQIQLESAGLVSKLYRVYDRYFVNFSDGGCPTDVLLKSEEGSRKRETRIVFDHELRKVSYLEKDMVKDTVILRKELTIPECAYDIVGALYNLRLKRLQPGQSTHIPITDGKKLVSARVEAQERETVVTPAGTFNTVRYEAFLFNNALYQKRGRLFIWLTDDERRLPVQIRVRMQFHVGTITLQLEKEERS